MSAIESQNIDQPHERRPFHDHGHMDVVTLGDFTLGKGTFEPGWRWSLHVGPATGAAHCHVEHVGMVVSGCATAAMADGSVFEMKAGDLFYIPPEPHDSWVVGEEPYVSLHFLGADHYAEKDG